MDEKRSRDADANTGDEKRPKVDENMTTENEEPKEGIDTRPSDKPTGESITTCGEGGHATVRGAQAAKGATGTMVGATCFWLVCSDINKCIARLEALRQVTSIQKMMDDSETFKAEFADSHEKYLHRVIQSDDILTPGEKESFTKMHLQEKSRRYGNAGTTNKYSVKCLHAHTASFLAGVPNPVGELTVKTLLATPTLSDDFQSDLVTTIRESTDDEYKIPDNFVQKLCEKCRFLAPSFGGDKATGKKRRRKKRLH
eukprot:TRINITY_DN22637_c0_g1_i1.p1 TRINITY_DN22637_c0_g1~~TRINITY_DN22637_c0_g1_i1.p1  ORF type:complete len:256 (+),score=48.46 TRINITY_DN22637_c0_g1_i1:46-813(+)